MRRNSGLGYRSEIVDGPRPFGFCVLRWPRRVGQTAAVKESIEGHLGAGVAPASIAFRGRSVVGEGPANRRPEHLLTGPTTRVPPPRRGPSCLEPGKQAHRVRHEAALGQVCGRPRVTSGGASPRFVGGNGALQALSNFCHVGIAHARIAMKQRECVHPVGTGGGSATPKGHARRSDRPRAMAASLHSR